MQALQRRLELKRRDSQVDRVVLVVAKHDRQVVREFRSTLLPTFPLGSRELIAALRRGMDAGGDGILFLRIPPVSTVDAVHD